MWDMSLDRLTLIRVHYPNAAASELTFRIYLTADGPKDLFNTLSVSRCDELPFHPTSKSIR